MSLYSRDDERKIRVQRLVDDWTKSGLLVPEQRDRILPELQVNLRRTNMFLRVTLFVFGYLIVNALAGLFVVTLNLSEDATMGLAVFAAVAFFAVAQLLVQRSRLYHFGVEEVGGGCERVVSGDRIVDGAPPHILDSPGADRRHHRCVRDLPAIRLCLCGHCRHDLRRDDSIWDPAG